jgi:hypothetical protein
MVMVSAPIVAAIVGKKQTTGSQFHSCRPNKFMGLSFNHYLKIG